MSRSRPSLATALVLLLSAVTGGSCDRRLYQIADAPAPSGSLRTNAKQQEDNGALSTTCSFNIKGETIWCLYFGRGADGEPKPVSLLLLGLSTDGKTPDTLLWHGCRRDG